MREERGTVLDFDEAAGFGTIQSEGGDLFFHCTAIADGSRTIAVGSAVVFDVVPGQNGRWEATRIRPAR